MNSPSLIKLLFCLIQSVQKIKDVILRMHWVFKNTSIKYVTVSSQIIKLFIVDFFIVQKIVKDKKKPLYINIDIYFDSTSITIKLTFFINWE